MTDEVAVEVTGAVTDEGEGETEETVGVTGGGETDVVVLENEETETETVLGGEKSGPSDIAVLSDMIDRSN